MSESTLHNSVNCSSCHFISSTWSNYVSAGCNTAAGKRHTIISRLREKRIHTVKISPISKSGPTTPGYASFPDDECGKTTQIKDWLGFIRTDQEISPKWSKAVWKHYVGCVENDMTTFSSLLSIGTGLPSGLAECDCRWRLRNRNYNV